MTLNQSSLNVLATRRAAVFNKRHPLGSTVMYISAVGAQPTRATVASLAFAAAGMVKVYLQGQPVAVDADRCFSAPQEAPKRALLLRAKDWLISAAIGMTPKRPVPDWKLAAAFVLGFAAAVVVGLLGPTAHAVPPEMISIDCDAPGAAPADVELVDQDGRAQA